MKLQEILKKLILEIKGKIYYESTITKGNRVINFGVSEEQEVNRGGSINPLTNKYVLTKIINGEWKSGIYNYWLKDLVKRNFDDVFDSVLENFEEGGRNRIIFIGSNEYFDQIEFIVDYDVISLTEIIVKVITSGSSDGTYYFFVNKQKDPRVDLYEENIEKIIKIYLAN
jgi:hypothetical protein